MPSHDDDAARDDAMRAVERSMPNPHRPRLSTELEAQLEPIERRAALAYAEIELATAALARAKEKTGPEK